MKTRMMKNKIATLSDVGEEARDTESHVGENKTVPLPLQNSFQSLINLP